MDSSQASNAGAALGSLIGGAVLCYFLFIVLLIVGTVFIYYKIVQRTGYNGWMALLMFVPLVNLGMLLYLAFSDWPVQQENRALRAQLGYNVEGPLPPAPGSYYAPTAGYIPPTAPYGGPPMAPQVPQVPQPPQPSAQPPMQPPVPPVQS
ncbi:MAG: hypothetical protein P4L93_01460 [Coriobacteriia bacterium]|nr:hypothetical protein [Coriobacteriia bacterium]